MWFIVISILMMLVNLVLGHCPSDGRDIPFLSRDCEGIVLQSDHDGHKDIYAVNADKRGPKGPAVGQKNEETKMDTEM